MKVLVPVKPVIDDKVMVRNVRADGSGVGLPRASLTAMLDLCGNCQGTGAMLGLPPADLAAFA